MTETIRLTAAQAMVRYLAAQKNAAGETYIAGCWAIFGHGNVAGLGEALYGARDVLPTYRGHNEQTMAHTAIAYGKQSRRDRAMMVTTSIGPGATNVVTAAALAHCNRLPVLIVPGDVFASRAPDPVLQQPEVFGDGTVSANDCFRPVSRYYDRITRPEHLLTALPRAMRVLTDPAECGPVTLAFCQDVQGEAFDYPASFFEAKTWNRRAPQPDPFEISAVADLLASASRPVIVAGGGVYYGHANEALLRFAETHNIPVTETQAGKSSMPWDHPLNLGPLGVTGGEAANEACAQADVVIGVGTRFQDFTTGSWSIFKNSARRLVSLNVQAYDAMKHGATPICADANAGLAALSDRLGGLKFNGPNSDAKPGWFAKVDPLTAPPGAGNALPTDMQVIGAVQRAQTPQTVVMGAAGTMPGELHKLWKAQGPGGYHMEYGFSCMGYEIAGAMGIKMAQPEADVIAMVGDGSYMMANSEMATAAMMGIGFTVVITDNRGFGCINRLQMGTGGAEFNNLLDTAVHETPSNIDFAAHAAAMGATAVKVSDVAELEAELVKAKGTTKPYVIVIDTDPYPSTEHGGAWWDVGVPEVSDRQSVLDARAKWDNGRKDQSLT
ncbi:MAG: 3D-(3,5/4)-trihydroxycyclohexane-1,2-dione acylhydrolase (decyclizing) [Marinovum sp.]|nr:3D-(3,5/4)-trihydroxycyclohexane-1,2-dione acylhydrolase (decyclizing) [Marinovum sp.]